MIFTKKFWMGATERGLKTLVQSFISALIVGIGAATSAWEVEWGTAIYAALGVSLLATFFSFATSLGNAEFTAGTNHAEIEELPSP